MENIIFKPKTKKYKREVDDITIELYNFVIENKKYILITIMILCNKKLENEEKFFRRPDMIMMDKKGEEKLKKYKSLILEFYDDDNKIAYRRGDFLELLTDKILPIKNQDNYRKIKEAKVFKKNEKLSNKDIDIVCISENERFIECTECKATLNNYLTDPLDSDSKEKLDLMELVKSILEEESKTTDLYFSTFTLSEKVIKEVINILEKEGYMNFQIIDGSMINSILLDTKLN